jgi:proteasome lid subunit RPN8/RPN11
MEKPVITKPTVRLLPETSGNVPCSRSPYHRAVHWSSAFDSKGPSHMAVDVFITQKAFVRVCAIAGSDLENEVGGWLIGKHRKDAASVQEFVVVEKAVAARKTRSGSAFLTFTQDSQVDLHHALEKRFPGRELVGWFHTHPRMGVFFSGWDEWLHHNFFPEPWHVALVIEPHSSCGGFFLQEADGNLDGRQYHGFFELNNGLQRSVVHWKNLEPDQEWALTKKMHRAPARRSISKSRKREPV